MSPITTALLRESICVFRNVCSFINFGDILFSFLVRKYEKMWSDLFDGN